MSELIKIYVCKRCMTPAGDGGSCAYCGGEMVGCRPGDPDDPCWRPLIDADGRVMTRAPRWWLHYSVPELMGHFEGSKPS